MKIFVNDLAVLLVPFLLSFPRSSNGKSLFDKTEINHNVSDTRESSLQEKKIQELYNDEELTKNFPHNININLFILKNDSSLLTSSSAADELKIPLMRQTNNMLEKLLNEVKSFSVNGMKFALIEGNGENLLTSQNNNSQLNSFSQNKTKDFLKQMTQLLKIPDQEKKSYKDGRDKFKKEKEGKDNLKRVKRGTKNSLSSDQEVETGKIINGKSVYPKTFDIGSWITDILLKRFPNQDNWAKPSSIYEPNNIFEVDSISTKPSHVSNYQEGFTKIPDSTPPSFDDPPPSSFDDISFSSDSTVINEEIDLERRLGKLDSIFKALNVDSEECKRRIICEISKDAKNLSPLSELLEHEMRMSKNHRNEAIGLLRSDDGIRFLSYIDATSRGKDRFKQCEIYKYHCRSTVKDLIDTDALMVWREVASWLTIKVLARNR